MGADREYEEAYQQLKKYCAGTPVVDEFVDLDEGADAGEQYYSLSWLFASILEHQVAIPRNVLIDVYGLLQQEDRDEYRPAVNKLLLKNS
ncbi:hypothetical protein [Alloscardovia sp. HMSC034E08]|uniref:hypothetical protein n=1 Tax=Alloscardovia sp. HMSC034E08 TaxID=1739413 RepID=UPI0008B2DA0A|nr:hypothetical protein [Alloscardovia sp. HMSC034E08]OFQ96666.1 hypothetical protein HMPREF2909_00425 [Alloscardovia sp. HMSC034E08]